MLSHPYFSDVWIESGKEKKEKTMSVKTNVIERKRRENSFDCFEDYYVNFIKDENKLKEKSIVGTIKNEVPQIN